MGDRRETPWAGLRSMDGPGRRAETALVIAALGAGTGIVLGNLAPPSPQWFLPLLGVACAAASMAILRHPSGRAWWLTAGLLAGAAACAVALHPPETGIREPVRFEATVRDGWREGLRGFENRLHVTRLERSGRWRRVSLDLRVRVGGELALRDLPGAGRRISAAGELRFDPQWPLRRPTATIKSAALITVVAGSDGIDGLRARLASALERSAGVDPSRIRAAALAEALVLGRRESLPAGEVELLRGAGVAHLLAVSGLHVGIVAALVWAALAVLPVPPAWRRLAVAAAILGFMLLAGGAPPVRRAAVGLALYLVSRTVGRRIDPFSAVAAIVAGLLLADPGAALDPGFQLSALVTLALVRWVEPVAGFLQRWLGRAAPAVAVVVVAQAASVPIVAATFGRVSPLGAIANLALVPLAFPIVAAGMAAVALAALGAGAGGLALAAVAALQNVLDLAAQALSARPFVAPLPDRIVVCLLIALAVVALSHVRAATAAAAGLVGMTLAWVALPYLPRPRVPALDMLPVREGAAVVIRGSTGTVLFDGGIGRMEAARGLAARGITRLQAVVVTHADADHTGGVAEILRDMHVGALVFPEPIGDRSEIVALRRLARELGVRERAVARAVRLTIGDIPVNVVWPPRDFRGTDNDGSLVAQAAVRGHTVLFTGDIEAAGERAALSVGPAPWRAEVLVVPHHGSGTSTTGWLVRTVAPVLAAIPTGVTPRYPYPAEAVRRRLHGAGVVILAQDAGFESVELDDGPVVTVEGSRAVRVNVRRSGR